MGKKVSINVDQFDRFMKADLIWPFGTMPEVGDILTIELVIGDVEHLPDGTIIIGADLVEGPKNDQGSG